MKRVLVLGLMLIATSAHAADFPATNWKDPVPDNLTFYGVTIFGAIDVGGAYQTHGAGFSNYEVSGLAYNVYGNKNLTGPLTSFTNNALQVSTVGFKVEEPLLNDWKAIAQFDTGFNPIAGELSDACQSLIQNNGKALVAQNTNGDAVRCGQAFNGSAFGGVSNATYGTLTFGRQFNLNASNILRLYDPLSGSLAFSLPTFGGGFVSGAGSPEAALWDNSVKYAGKLGSFYGAAMFTQGGQGQPVHGASYNFDLGATWQGFTIDGTYTRQHGATAAFVYAPGGCGTPGTPSCNTLNGNAFDSTEYAVGLKYTFNLAGGLLPPSKLTFSGAYAYVTVSNPDDPLSVGTQTIGGYTFGAINNNAFGTNKILQTSWIGVNYELSNGWTFTGAYYYVDQGAYVTHFGPATIGPCSGTATANCRGTLDTLSGMVDYAFDKHFDVYAGVSLSHLTGGLASGYINDNTTTAVSGVRLRF